MLTVDKILNRVPLSPDIATIEVASDNPNYASINGVLYNKALTELLCYPIRHSSFFDQQGDATNVITLPEGLKVIGPYAFYECSWLENILLPGSLSRIGDHAFHYCSSLKNFPIPKGVGEIGEGAFYSCTKITTINLPDGLSEIAKAAFMFTINLENIFIPDSVQLISQSAFEVSGLNSITIPANVTSIEERAFNYCQNLVSIYFEGNAPDTQPEELFQHPSVPIPFPTIFYFSNTHGWADTFAGAPTVKLQGEGKWRGAYVFENWLYTPWLGWFQIIDEDLGDIDHLLLGDCWVKRVNDQQYWLRTSTLGWIYIYKDWSPWFWRMDDSHWYWLNQDGWPPRGWDYDDQEWEELGR